jgi:heat shock protein HtpX
MKRILLFLATNLAVMLVLAVTLRLLGVDRYLTANGLDVGALMAFSLMVGFAGSILSLLISKPLARWSTGARVIDAPRNADEAWLLATVRRLAQRAGIGRPDVAIYEGAPNAFATGAFRDSALVQGVVNTFVVFFARVVGYLVDTMVLRRSDDERHAGSGPGFYVTVFACEIAFGLFASMIVAWFSRQREFRADAGSSHLLGTPAPMMAALARLGGLTPGGLPSSLRAFGITDMPAWLGLFASHPPIEARIAALRGAHAVVMAR